MQYFYKRTVYCFTTAKQTIADMSSGIIITGLAIAAAGFTGRYLLRNRQLIRKTITISDSGMFSKYYKGGFEKRMTRSEAALILGGRNKLSF